MDKDQVSRDLEEFQEKELPGESWDVYLARRNLERWLESSPNPPPNHVDR